MNNRKERQILIELRTELTNRVQMRDDTPYWVDLLRVYNVLNNILYQKWIKYLILKDTKVSNAKERPKVKWARKGFYGLVSEHKILAINESEFNQIKNEALVLTDLTEKKGMVISLNFEGKSRFLKGCNECIFHLRYEPSDFDGLELSDNKTLLGDKRKFVERIRREVIKEFNRVEYTQKGLTPPRYSKTPSPPPEYVEYVKCPTEITEWVDSHAELLQNPKLMAEISQRPEYWGLKKRRN